MSRSVLGRYVDPLDAIWLEVATRCGLRVVRASDAYASYDGKGTLTLASPEYLDPDDCLAQMILHELCHAAVQGPEAIHHIDWGLSVEGLDALEEHATHRVQAALADPYGLRRFFAVTTDWRPYYDALPVDPLSGDDPAVPLANAAFVRVNEGAWGEPIRRGLEATAQFRTIVRGFVADADLLWAQDR